MPISPAIRRLGSAIAALLSTPALAAPCSPADLTADGQIDFSDYLEFLNLYEAADLRVDFTGDSQIDFGDYLEFLNLYDAGCPSVPAILTPLAGRALGAYPFVEFIDAYNDGQAVMVAVDPARHPQLTGATARIYITAARSASTWAADPALVDVRPGGFQTFTFPGGSIQANTFTLDDSASLPSDAGEDIGLPYDLIIDANRNGLLDTGDLIDGAAPTPASPAGFYKLRDLTTSGPAPVTTIPRVTIPTGRVRSNYEDARWYFPADIASRGRLPLILFSVQSGDSYTWHDHLGQFLASYGFIMVVPENGACGASCLTTDTTCLLDHLNTIIDLQATLAGGVLDNHIDTSEIYLIGHSLGGQTVVLALDRLRSAAYTPTGGHPLRISADNIKYLQTIGPTDFLPTLGQTQPGNVDFHLIYGSANGDISGGGGSDIVQPFNIFERATGRRASTYIHGADANDFSCCGFDDFTGPAGTAIGRPEAQRIQRAVTLSSLLHFRRGNIPCKEVLWRQWEAFRPLGISPSVTVVSELKQVADKLVIDDFQDAADNPAICSNPAWSASFDVAAAVEGPRMNDTDTTFTWPGDTWNGMTRARTTDTTDGLVFEYDAAQPSRRLTFTAAAPVDAAAYEAISFRMCQMTRHTFTQATLGDQDFEIELEDSSGRASRIRLSSFGGGIEEPYPRTGAGLGAGWQNEFETVRIHLAAFTSGHGSAGAGAPDLASLKHIRFLFGPEHGTPQGRLALDDVELTAP